MISKREWHQDRILWRLSRHNKQSAITSSLWASFKNENEDAAKYIRDHIGEESEPILAYWRNENRWTALTAAELFSVVDGETTIILLDEIQKCFSPKWTTSISRKGDLEFLFVGPTKQQIWAPPGARYFALWNVLLMFPLNVPEDSRDE